MKNIQNKLLILSFIIFILPQLGYSQNNSNAELVYEVHRIYPPLSITKAQLNKARTLIDLNSNYKASWIKEYKSVEILVSQNGKIQKAKSFDNLLTQNQKELMHSADNNSEILVNVQYIPNKSLSPREVKEYKFSFTIDSENEAAYAGGQEQLKAYFKENAIDLIPQGSFDQAVLAILKFTIDEQGNVTNTQVFESSRSKQIDALLLDAIKNMSSWKPASYANGQKVKQDFVFTVGNMESCALNFVHIDRN